MILEKQDRIKFCQWLENEIVTGRQFAIQLRDMGVPHLPNKCLEEAKAAEIILNKLQSFERQTI